MSEFVGYITLDLSQSVKVELNLISKSKIHQVEKLLIKLPVQV